MHGTILKLFQRKQKIHLGGFIRLLVGNILSNNFDLVVSKVDSKGALSLPEKQQLINHLPTFALVTLSFLVMDKVLRREVKANMEKAGELLALATAFGYKDAGFTDEEAQNQTERFNEELQEYGLATSDHPKEEDTGKLLCQHFATKFFPNLRLNDEKDRYKYYIIITTTHQLYKIILEDFDSTYRQVRIVV